MANCLLSLGSNVGDREATLRDAIAEITALPDIQLVRHSEWRPSEPVGGPADQAEFLNGVALFETTTSPPLLLAELNSIEARHGRQRAERWSPRTLDIDILLYGNEVVETEMLTLPHPRMSFRRFVLEPAAEVAPKMLHPTIGWPVERLLLHLNMASDQLAIVSLSNEVRTRVANDVARKLGAQSTETPAFATAEHHWPTEWTSWLTLPPSTRDTKKASAASPAIPYAAAQFPKLTILIDSDPPRPADKLRWSTLVRQPGRGPTLRLRTTNTAEIDADVFAAIRAVWP